MSDTPFRPAPHRSPVERAREWVQWVGPWRLVSGVLAVVVAAAVGWWLLAPPPATTESRLPFASTATTTATTDAPARVTDTAGPAPPPDGTTAVPVVVHVAGAVVSPGVYTLPAGSRVVDALTEAGGAVPDADTDAINLAAIVVDGQRIYVPHRGEVVPVADTPAGPTTPSGPVDINRATAEQLDDLPGVGPATAAAIIRHREEHGPFASVDDLADVRGIGPAKLDALRGLVTV